MVPGPDAKTLEEKARFYHALGALVRAEELEWGGA